MYALNIRGLHWSTVKNSSLVLSCIFLFACSSTQQVQTQRLSENEFFKEYREVAIDANNEHLFHDDISLINTPANRSHLYSDHQLMMSLLNRPITSDQAMMIAIAKEREHYNYSLPDYGIAIKGDKSMDKNDYRPNNRYTNLIIQDINSVNISAPN